MVTLKNSFALEIFFEEMRKKLSWLDKAKILKKIAIARKITEKMVHSEDTTNSNNLFLKLKEITDKAELIYNDAKIKSYKSLSAIEEMRECEKQLDELLSELSKFQKPEIEK